MKPGMQYRLRIPVSEKSKKSPIPDRDRLEAYARFLQGGNLEELTRDLYERYDVTPPKYAAQAYSAFLRKVARLVERGDVATIEMAEEVNFPMDEIGPGNDDANEEDGGDVDDTIHTTDPAEDE